MRSLSEKTDIIVPNLTETVAIAVNFTADSIRHTYKTKTDYRFGVNFEQSFLDFLKELKLV